MIHESAEQCSAFLIQGLINLELPDTIHSHPCDHGIYNFHVENGLNSVTSGVMKYQFTLEDLKLIHKVN